MRKACTLIILLFFAVNLQAQWHPLALNYTYTKRPDFFVPQALHFSDTAHGFILNDATLLQYKDQLWRMTKKNDSDLFTYTNLFTVDPANTFLCSYDGKIAKYDGDSLSVIFRLPPKEDSTYPALNTIFMVDTREGWVAGDSGVIIKIENDTIEKDILSVYQNFKDIYFDRPDHGWMIGYQLTDFGSVGVLYEYIDHHWTLTTYLDEMLYDIEFSSSGIGFITGEYGIYRYNQELNEWQPENIPNYYRQFHLSLLNNEYGISVSDNGRNMIYENGNWFDAPAATVSDLFSIKTTGPGKAWAISQIGNNDPENLNEGKIQLLDNGNWSAYSSSNLDSVSVVPVDYAITNLTGIGKKQLWVNGLYLLLPPEKNWFDTVPTLPGESFTNVAKMFSDSFGLGINGNLVEWNGHSWINKNIDAANPDTSFVNLNMQVFDDTTAFIGRQYLVWTSGEIRTSIAKYDYSSNSLLGSTDLDSRLPFGLHFSDKRNGLCVGDSGLLAKYQDDTWNILPNVTENRLNAVFMPDSVNAWVVGNAGTLLKFHENEWVKLPLPTEQNLLSIYFTDSLHGWIAGDSGLVFKYNGDSWQKDTTITTTSNLYAIYMADSTFGFAAGDNGTLLQYIQKKDSIIIQPATEKRICESGSTYFNYNPQGLHYVYQWQVDMGNGFENLDNNNVFSGVASDTLRIANLLPEFYGYKFRCIASYDGVDSIGTIEELLFKNKWTGKSDSAWENPENWSCEMLPGRATDVIITAGNIVISSPVAIRSLTVLPGANITVAEGGGLEILK